MFQFPDGSKVRNTRVELRWDSTELYDLLFTRLRQNPSSSDAFLRLRALASSRQSVFPALAGQKAVVDAIAGEFMGAGKKRGRVHSWLPLHLSDALGETSPRTFLTAWREAAHHHPSPSERAVDHAGLLEGVRKASEDRLHELREDYWWVSTALSPLRGHTVPMERAELDSMWRDNATVSKIRNQSGLHRLAPLQLEEGGKAPEDALVSTLAAIGIIEIRPNGKINVPDIFRVEAGIKRKGGVKPPRRLSGDGA